jgi:hypothetical protein
MTKPSDRVNESLLLIMKELEDNFEHMNAETNKRIIILEKKIEQLASSKIEPTKEEIK